ncbi:unnamed protein product, partial [Staurois parvus]
PCTASSCCCQGSRVCHGPPYRTPHCCCQARNLSWAPTVPPHMLLPGPECVMGPCTRASHCCCQARKLPWAPVNRLLMLLPGPVCSWVPVRPPLLLSLSPHSAMCHFQVSSHCWWVSIFVIGCCMASHCCCLHATLWLHTLVLAPVTAQMSEVCGDS